MAKDTFYFTHDYNTRNDEKIKALLFKHGLLGYGVFWAIVEDLYNNANALQTDYERIAFELRADKIIVESVIKDFGLFVFEGSIFGSHSVQKRLEDRLSKSTKARESAFKRWNKDSINANALPPQSEGNAIKESKGDEIKESKESKLVEQNEILPIITNPEFLKFNKWILDNALNVSKLKEPITQEQFIKLKENYSPLDIKEVLMSMHNKKDLLKKYNSAYLTLVSWLKRNKSTNQNNNNKNGKSTIELNREARDRVIAKLTGDSPIS